MMLFLKLIVPNFSNLYPWKDYCLALLSNIPLSDTKMEIPKSIDRLLGGMLD